MTSRLGRAAITPEVLAQERLDYGPKKHRRARGGEEQGPRSYKGQRSANVIHLASLLVWRRCSDCRGPKSERWQSLPDRCHPRAYMAVAQRPLV